MAKDISRFFFNFNGYTFKSIRSANFDEPENQVEQSESDIYGEHDNIETPSKKIVFTIVVPIGEIDELTANNFMVSKVEGAGTYIDKRGNINNTITYNKGRIQKKTKGVDRSTDTVEYTIIASRIADTTIKA